jgi:hypothetical protein
MILAKWCRLVSGVCDLRMIWTVRLQSRKLGKFCLNLFLGLSLLVINDLNMVLFWWPILCPDTEKLRTWESNGMILEKLLFFWERIYRRDILQKLLVQGDIERLVFVCDLWGV